MADPLSISASIIALLQLTATVIDYISDTKGASEEWKRILVEARNVHYLLFLLKDRAERSEQDGWTETMKSLNISNRPLEQFKAALERLVAKAKPPGTAKKIGKALMWSFKKEEVKDILSTIERLISLFTLALENDNMYASTGYVVNTVNFH
jgi:hypothetical protein